LFDAPHEEILISESKLQYDYRFVPLPALKKVEKRRKQVLGDEDAKPISVTNGVYGQNPERYVGSFHLDLYSGGSLKPDPLTVTDDSDLEEIYNTERHLLYVACTRARDHLLVTSVEPASEFLDDLQT
jgi:hypothetical protein